MSFTFCRHRQAPPQLLADQAGQGFKGGGVEGLEEVDALRAEQSSQDGALCPAEGLSCHHYALHPLKHLQ